MGTTRFRRHVKRIGIKSIPRLPSNLVTVTTTSPSFPKLSEGFYGRCKAFSHRPSRLLQASADGVYRFNCTLSDATSSANPRVTQSFFLLSLQTHFQRRRRQDTPRLFQEKSRQQRCGDTKVSPRLNYPQASAPLSDATNCLNTCRFWLTRLRAAVLGS
jgi:hypothetical protein